MSRLEHFRGHEDFVARLEDMLDVCERQNRVIFTPFLSESEGRIVEQICGKSRLQRSWGGYPQAQRRCLCAEGIVSAALWQAYAS